VRFIKYIVECCGSAWGVDKECLQNFSGKVSVGKQLLGELRRRCEDNIKMNLMKISSEVDRTVSGSYWKAGTSNSAVNFVFCCQIIGGFSEGVLGLDLISLSV
jgi:hypothetical protein